MTVFNPAERRAQLAARLARVYLLTPEVDAADFASLNARLDAMLAAGGSAVQYRSKAADAGERAAQARAVQAVARAHRALFIVNDDVELAAALSADGVHLGRDDGDLAAARARLPGALLGASCYDDAARAARAVEAGADVLAFGAVFESSTKPHAVRAPLALLATARARWPAQRIVAIGGIDAGNIRQVAAAGAHAAAIIGAAFATADPVRAVRELQTAFDSGKIDP